MLWKPAHVLAWCAYSAGWWEDPLLNGQLPPGIVACGELDGGRHGASQTFFAKGRSRGNRWTWVSLAKTRHEWNDDLEAFIRSYFAAILDGAAAASIAGQWRDVDTKARILPEQAARWPTLTAWLPNSELDRLWTNLHCP